MDSSQIFIGLSLSLLLMGGCEVPSRPSEPTIDFGGYEWVTASNSTDSALSLLIRFEDGDGDLGLDPVDTFPPFNLGSPYYYNIFAFYYEKVDGQFQEVTISEFSNDTIRFHGRFPRLDKQYPRRYLKGTIRYTLPLFTTRKSDTIRFRIRIYDRALHPSNEILTPPFIYRK